MSSILRINSITSRTGINTLDFTGNGFSYVTSVGFGTTNPRATLDVEGNLFAMGGKVGIGTTLPTSKLDIVGDVQIAGVITATQFKGDGSTLTGVAATSNIRTNAIDNSGVTTVSAGSTAIPSISPSGNPNTGLYFPATNSVALAAGGASRIRVFDNGQIGIGSAEFVQQGITASGRAPRVGLWTGSSPSADNGGTHMASMVQNNQNTLDVLMYNASDVVQIAATNGEQNLSLVCEDFSNLSSSTSKGIYIKGNIGAAASVGIGTTNPRTVLSIKGGSQSTQTDIVNITNTGAGNNCQPTIRFDTIDFNSNVLGRISFKDLGSFTGDFVVETAAPKVSGDSVTTERFRVSGVGTVTPGANGTQDLGSNTLRWANIYTNDLQLSNEGSVNEVDGTWGNYTIQEGENDLFLLNRRNGKKYKFVLEEVN